MQQASGLWDLHEWDLDSYTLKLWPGLDVDHLLDHLDAGASAHDQITLPIYVHGYPTYAAAAGPDGPDPAQTAVLEQMRGGYGKLKAALGRRFPEARQLLRPVRQ
jgi:hypothetical protein